MQEYGTNPRMTQQSTEWLSPADVARELGLTRRAVLVGPLRRGLPWVRVTSRVLRLRREDLAHYLERTRGHAA